MRTFSLLVVLFCVSLLNAQDKAFSPAKNKAIKEDGYPERRLALVIGNKDYQEPGASLTNPIHDAQDMKNALEQVGFDVMFRTNLDYRSLQQSIDSFSRILKNRNYEVGLFYYSGHGISHNNENYIVPVDASIEGESEISYNCVALNRTIAQMENSGTRTNLVFLDACRNNIFKISGAKSLATKGLVMPNNPPGSMIVFATGPGMVANDNAEERNGLFTGVLLKHLTKPDITLRQMLDQTKREVRKRSNNTQDPKRYDELEGDFIFVRKVITENVTQSDTDADGIPDSEDSCPTRYGTKANKGCPQEASGTDDYDRDGISDSVDPCPTEYGTANGCPDIDKDGVPDKSDRCKSLAGKPEWEGCPDTDSDGIPDHLDKCPQEFGSMSYNGCAPSKTTPIVSSMVSIPASSNVYKMGNVFQDDGYADETITSVSLSPFTMDKYETTFAEYDKFCDATGKEKPDDQGWGRGKRPVINVSWYDAIEYGNWRSEQEGKTPCYTIDKYTKDPNNENRYDEKKWLVTCNWQANGYRLPTHTEWEYAASWDPIQQKKNRFGNGKDIADPTEMNFNAIASYKESYSNAGEYREKTLEVGSFQPNAMGLFDMAGNVWEWCWYDSKNLKGFNPKGGQSGSIRVLCGGGWVSHPGNCRAAYRLIVHPDFSYYFCGFRLVSSNL